MNWRGAFHDEFAPEFRDLPVKVQDEVYTVGRLLEQFGLQLGRPQVDTLNGSRHANMKEMRFGAADGEWRVAFAFDPVRETVLLVAGDKSGGSGVGSTVRSSARPTSGSTGTLPASPMKGERNDCKP